MSELCRWRQSEGYGACGDDVERTSAHPVSVDLQPIVFRRIRHTNILFYQFKECHKKFLRFRT